MSPARYRVHDGHLVFNEMAIPENAVIHGDCIPVMAGMPTASVDFVLTDPPYICNYRDRQGRTIANDTNGDWLLPAFREIYRLMNPDTLCISLYGWTATEAFLSAWAAAGFRRVGHIVFCKDYASRTGLFEACHECAYVLAKGRPIFRQSRCGANAPTLFQLLPLLSQDSSLRSGAVAIKRLLIFPHFSGSLRLICSIIVCFK